MKVIASYKSEARREQIIKAAIEVLNEVGYVNTSLSKIAKKAKISTGLISYHFLGKEDLMNHTLLYLVEKESSFIYEQVAKKQTATEKLITFMEASLEYQATNRMNNIALIEIVFHARTADHTPYYLINDDEEDMKTNLLQEILLEGKKTKEFIDIPIQAVTTIIQGAISESMLTFQNKASLTDFREQLIATVLKIVN